MGIIDNQNSKIPSPNVDEQQVSNTEIAPDLNIDSNDIGARQNNANRYNMKLISASNWIALISLLLVLISLSVAVYTIRWRKALKGGQTSIVPQCSIGRF